MALKASRYVVVARFSRVKFKGGRRLSSLDRVAFARRDWALDRSVPA